jgi:arylsulfatase A-like enzyme
MENMMKRREFLKKCVWAAGTVTLSNYVSCARESTTSKAADPFIPARKPNFVFIFIDDMGWKDVGFMGSKYYETPNIDKLASQGMVFTDAYANAPNCAPTRACLMSGQYGPRHGVYTVGTAARGKSKNRKLIPVENKTELNGDIVTIAEAIKQGGYVNASMGKWHLGIDPELGPIGQGFDVNIGGNHRGSPGGGGYFSPYKNPDLPDGPQGEYLTDRLTEEAIKFIADNQDKPFFLYLTHYAVHTPIQAKEKLAEKYRDKPSRDGQGNAKYAAMIESVDQGVGRIMKTLEELKLDEDSVVIFFSDNGGYGKVTSMAPLRGAKGMLYEGGIREPMIVRWQGKVQAGTKCAVPVIGIDFYPTMLELAGMSKPEDTILDGESIVGLLKGGNELKRKAIFWHFPAYLEGRNFEGARDEIFRNRPCGAVRVGDWKLIEYFEDGHLELYNLKNDLSETTNLAQTKPDKRDELHKVMKEWRVKVNAPVPTQLNPEYQA